MPSSQMEFALSFLEFQNSLSPRQKELLQSLYNNYSAFSNQANNNNPGLLHETAYELLPGYEQCLHDLGYDTCYFSRPPLTEPSDMISSFMSADGVGVDQLVNGWFPTDVFSYLESLKHECSLSPADILCLQNMRSIELNGLGDDRKVFYTPYGIVVEGVPSESTPNSFVSH